MNMTLVVRVVEMTMMVVEKVVERVDGWGGGEGGQEYESDCTFQIPVTCK